MGKHPMTPGSTYKVDGQTLTRDQLDPYLLKKYALSFALYRVKPGEKQDTEEEYVSVYHWHKQNGPDITQTIRIRRP